MQLKSYPPKNVKAGAVWFSTHTNHFYRFNGAKWIVFTPKTAYSESTYTEDLTYFFTQKKQPKISLWEIISNLSIWKILLRCDNMKMR